MSELVTCVLAALNGFCAVWKFAKNQNLWPNGFVSGVPPSSSGSCASAAPPDSVTPTAHAAARTGLTHLSTGRDEMSSVVHVE